MHIAIAVFPLAVGRFKPQPFFCAPVDYYRLIFDYILSSRSFTAAVSISLQPLTFLIYLDLGSKENESE